MIHLPIILIDNGHGINTAGKCSPAAAAGLIHSPLYFREFSWNRTCAAAIVEALQAKGHTAFLLVKETEDVKLQERAERVNAYCRGYGKENVILVSIHSNAAPGAATDWHTARGWSAYTTPGTTSSDALATCLYNRAEEILAGGRYARTFEGKVRAIRKDMTDGDPDIEDNFYILRKTACTAVLTENLFQDNKEDVAFLKSPEGLADIVRLHVEGIEDFITRGSSEA